MTLRAIEEGTNGTIQTSQSTHAHYFQYGSYPLPLLPRC